MLPKRRKQLQRLTWLLETSLQIPGTKIRFGLDALLGLIPFAGDLVGLFCGLFYVAVAIESGIHKRDLLKISYWILLDGILGMIPILGDYFDYHFRAHLKIQNLLESKYWQNL